MALALLREIEDDTRIAAKISEGPSPLQTPELSKLTHFALIAFTQLAYASGSHELRAMASWMPFDLSYLTRALSTLMSLAHKALGTRTSIEDLLKVCVTEGPGQPGAENKPNPFANIVEAKWTGFKLDVIADSSLIFTVGPETQGVTRDEKGKLKAPAGWTSSLGGVHETMKNFQTFFWIDRYPVRRRSDMRAAHRSREGASRKKAQDRLRRER